MTTFLKRAWATLTTLPVYAVAFSQAVSEGAHRLGEALPGHSAIILQVGADVVSVIAFGSFVVTRVTPVAKKDRGFAQAPVKVKLEDYRSALDAIDDLTAKYGELKSELAQARQASVAAAKEQPAPAAPEPPPV